MVVMETLTSEVVSCNVNVIHEYLCTAVNPCMSNILYYMRMHASKHAGTIYMYVSGAVLDKKVNVYESQRSLNL